MKWQTASISLLGLTLLLLLAGGMVKWLPAKNEGLFSPEFTGNDLQLGYYDLLAHQREIYDTRFEVKGKTVLMTLTSPNDNRFMSKVSFEQLNSSAKGVQYSHRQIYYVDSGEPRMIRNMLGYAERNSVFFEKQRFGAEQLVITPSGQIFSYQ